MATRRKPAKKRPRVPDNEVALGKMRQRTPLRLTAEDEAIMREDWLLDPEKLPQVRIYQELLKMQRENQTLRVQVSERDDKLRKHERLEHGWEPDDQGQRPADQDEFGVQTSRAFARIQAPAGSNTAMLTLLERLMDDFKTYLRAST